MLARLYTISRDRARESGKATKRDACLLIFSDLQNFLLMVSYFACSSERVRGGKKKALLFIYKRVCVCMQGHVCVCVCLCLCVVQRESVCVCVCVGE